MNGEQMISAEWQREQQADCIVVGRHTHTHRQTHRIYVCACVCHSYANGALHIKRSAHTQRKSVLILETMQAEPL